jgi:hypothetical protein
MTLLAVDLGLYAGLAAFNDDGLLWFRSQNFSTITRLKKAIPRVLDECPLLHTVVVEGDRHLGELWQRAAEKRRAHTIWVRPETWRESLLLPREMRSGATAKENALRIAREIIDASPVKKPRTPLVDDVAEAICIGRWAMRMREDVARRT